MFIDSLADQTLIIGVKESGETHAKVMSHGKMLPCQPDSLLLGCKTTEYLYNAIKCQLLKKETWKRNMNLRLKRQH